MTLPLNSPNTDSSSRVIELDGIRGLAILLVLLWHYVGNNIVPHTSELGDLIAKVTATTWSGVDLFFVLSGFLIGGILLDNRIAPNYFKAFYARRITRIFPLYFCWLLLFIGLTLGFAELATTVPIATLFANPLPLWTYFTFTQNLVMGARFETGPHWLGVTWSLAVEEQFYLALPLLIRLVPVKRLPLILILIIYFAPVFRTGIAFLMQNNFPAYVLLPGRADALVLGVGCAYIMRQARLKNFLVRNVRWQYLGLVFLLTSVVYLTATSPSGGSSVMVTWGYSIFALFYACFLLLAITEQRGFVTAIVRNKMLRKLGVVAYGVYLFHQSVNWLVHGLILNQIPQIQTGLDVIITILALGIVVLMASLSWSSFEKKFIALGHRIKYAPM